MIWQHSRRTLRLTPYDVAVLAGVIGSAKLAALPLSSDERPVDLRLSGG